jgi:tetratricopeptide (TPR) repeat protein
MQGRNTEVEDIFLDYLEHFKKSGDRIGKWWVFEFLTKDIYPSQQPDLARKYAKQYLAEAQEAGNLLHSTRALDVLIRLEARDGKYESRQIYLDQYREINQKLSRSDTLYSHYMGIMKYELGEYEEARKHLQDALEMENFNGGQIIKNWIEILVAFIDIQTGNLENAYTQFKASSIKFIDIQLIGVVFILEGFAHLAVALERPEPAALVLGWADPQRRKINDLRPIPEQKAIDLLLNYIYERLPEAQFEAAQARGKDMTKEEIIEYALTEIKP